MLLPVCTLGRGQLIAQLKELQGKQQVMAESRIPFCSRNNMCSMPDVCQPLT